VLKYLTDRHGPPGVILRAVRRVHKLRVQSRPDVSRSETPSYSSAMRMSSPLAETQRTLRTAGSEDKTEGCSPCALRVLARNMRCWVYGCRAEAWTMKGMKSMKEKIQRLLLAKARRTRRKSRFNRTQCQCLAWRSLRLGEKHEALGVRRQIRSLDQEEHEGEDPTSASRKGAKDAKEVEIQRNTMSMPVLALSAPWRET